MDVTVGVGQGRRPKKSVSQGGPTLFLSRIASRVLSSQVQPQTKHHHDGTDRSYHRDDINDPAAAMTDGAETPGHNILAAGTQTLQQEEKDAARENTAQTTMIAHLLQITLQQWSVPVQLQSAC